MSEIATYDTIIIGNGIAGLSVARALSPHHSIAILAKGQMTENATHFAQGGIAVALNKDDTPACHYDDTLAAGAGLCDEQAVRILVQEGPARVSELIQLGIEFDRDSADFHYTKEGAHSMRRILHARDATGREIERVLRQDVQQKPHIRFWDNASVISLCVNDRGCYGCVVIINKKPVVMTARHVVLATGGCGQIFSHNTTPPGVTGDGIALAYRVGAAVQDMEFIQFHPTTLYMGDKRPISIFLISEAVRGEGAVLRNNLGERFMPRYHPQAELAPRDIVARAIISEMAATHAAHVLLDLSQIKVDIPTRFPTIYHRCLEANIDITRDLVPVIPAAHYMMGGVATDMNGRTSIPYLYAVGEVSVTGVHGANRLASNSLLDGLVVGYRVAQNIQDSSGHPITPNRCVNKIDFPDDRRLSNKIRSRVLMAKQTIRDTMWTHVGIVRHASGMDQAISQLRELSDIDRIQTSAPDICEVQHMRLVAQLMAEFASRRCESRGAHYRSDYPNRDDVRWSMHQRQAIEPSLNICRLPSQF